MITFIDENQVDWEDDSLEADMTEVEARLAVKPAKLRPIVKTGDVLMDGSRDDKAKMKTSLANIPYNPQLESSKKEIETSLAATPTNVQVDSTKDNSMQSKEMDEMQMSVAHMPANARDSESDRAETRNLDGDRAESPRELEIGTAELGLPSKHESSTSELEMPSSWTRCWRKYI